MKSLHSTFVLW